MKLLLFSPFIFLATLCSGNTGNQATDINPPLDQTVPAGQETSNQQDTLTIAMTGDIMMGTTFPSNQLPPNEGRDIFSHTRDITLNANLAVGNLEGTLCDGGQTKKKPGPHCYAFRTPTSFGPRLTEAGYDFLSMANNHANDFGQFGIESTERTSFWSYI